MQRSVDVQGRTNIAVAGAGERVFYIARCALRGAIQGVAYSPNGLQHLIVFNVFNHLPHYCTIN